jgi:hypothetical protein
LVKPRTDRRNTVGSDSKGHGARVAEAQPGDAVLTDGDRIVDLVEHVSGGDRVVAEPVGGEQSPVGREADLPQRG